MNLNRNIKKNFFHLVITPLKNGDLPNIEWSRANSSDEIPYLKINFQGRYNSFKVLTNSRIGHSTIVKLNNFIDIMH